MLTPSPYGFWLVSVPSWPARTNFRVWRAHLASCCFSLALRVGLGLGLGLDTRLMQSRCITMIALMQVRGSQVSMGAEGGSNALSTENGCSLQNFSDFVHT